MVCVPCLEGLQTAPNVFEPKPGQVLRPDSLRWSCGWESKTSFEVLRASKNECYFCSIILENFMRYDAKSPGDEVEVRLRYTFMQHVDESQLPYLTLTAFAASFPDLNKIFLVEDVARVGEFDMASRPLVKKGEKLSLQPGCTVWPVKGGSTGSVKALTFLKHNFTTCLKSHDICSKLTNKLIWYPTRLIEILDDGARLIDTNETEPSGSYASLSHRWGKSQMFRCTTETLVSLKKVIPVSELPLTFREAFDVLRFLGIKYIWIDSICIIQDSDEDWTREAKLMMKVYQQAAINLAATVSAGGESGLFTKRNPNALISTPFQISNGVLDEQYQAVESVLDKVSWDPKIEEAPLNMRGWVLQERLLSPRVAHFTADQIVWDCSDHTASESIPSGAFAKPGERSPWIGPKKHSKPFEEATESENIIDEWKNMVNKYSMCDLTYDSDRLIAMQGIKSSFEELLSEKFVCGFARTDLEMQLCWHKRDGSNFAQHYRTEIAPSWSWLSLKGPVSMAEIYYFKLANISGHPLKMHAGVEDISTVKTIDYGSRGLKYTGSMLLRCFLNPVEIKNTGGRLMLKGIESHNSVHLDTPEISDNDALYFAIVFEMQERYMVHCNSHSRGILLKLLDEANATFERCGAVVLGARDNPDTTELPQAYCRLTTAEGKESLPCKDFNVQKGHLIEIV